MRPLFYIIPALALAVAAHGQTKTAAKAPVKTKAVAPAEATSNAPRAYKEEDFYRIQNIVVPEGVLLEVGGLCTLPDQRVAVATRRGDIYIINNAQAPDRKGGQVVHFATGMHEPLGLAYREGSLWVSQRGGLTRLTDVNGDGRADRYDNVYTYPISGNYHEYAYGPKFDKDGNAYVTMNVGFNNPDWWLGKSSVPWRGWALKISADGKTMTPIAAGVRSPAGIGVLNDRDLFYTDNQGDWVGSGMLMHLEPGDFAHNPASLNWAHLPESPVKLKPSDFPITDARPLVEKKKDFPAIKLPAVWLPHGILGSSNSDILPDSTAGAFGPFAGQVFIGDQNQAMISRVSLEKVKGKYQGAAFQFRKGFASGVMRMSWDNAGGMYVGGTDRGWKSVGPKPWALQRMVWSGNMPFEMLDIKARPDGFEVFFTKPVDAAKAADVNNWKITSFTYHHHWKYGSPTINVEQNAVRMAQVSADGKSCRLVVDGLRLGYIHQINGEGVVSQDNELLLHTDGYYTLNELPDGEKLVVTAAPKPAAKPAAAPAPATKPAATAHDHSAHAGHAMPAAPAAVPTKAVPVKLTAAKPAGSAKRQLTMPADFGGKVDNTIQLGTAVGMKFDQNYLEVRANSRVKWIFTNYDDMTHNCLIVKPGKHLEVGNMAIKLGLNGQKKNYIPESDLVLFHTNMLQSDQTETIYFRAPSVPGDYEFVCTLPGHATSMTGILRVTK